MKPMKPSSKTTAKKSMEILLFDIPPLPANAINKTKSKVRRGSKSFVSPDSASL